MEWLGHKVGFFLAFKELSILISIMASLVCSPTSGEGGLSSLISPPAFAVYCSVDFCHSDWAMMKLLSHLLSTSLIARDSEHFLEIVLSYFP